MLPSHFRDLTRQSRGIGDDGRKQPVFIFNFADMRFESFAQIGQGRVHVGLPDDGCGRTGDPGLEPRHCLLEVDTALARCVDTSMSFQGSSRSFEADTSRDGVVAHMDTLRRPRCRRSGLSTLSSGEPGVRVFWPWSQRYASGHN